MKHATAGALDRLEPLLAKVRRHGGLKEKSRGVFYFKSKAVLHFMRIPQDCSRISGRRAIGSALR